MIKVFIGYDRRQDESSKFDKMVNAPYEVCRKSIHSFNPNVEIIPLRVDHLKEGNLYWRDEDPLAATEFSFTRFLVPHMSSFNGISIFCDSDFLWQCSIEELLNFYNDKYSVMCVKHDYTPKSDTKMDGKAQTVYPRKNWSSLMLFNCSHSDCKNLTREVVNSASPKYLHRMEWTKDENIGEIPLTYNWLEGEYKADHNPKAIHFTNGGPWHETWEGEYSKNWIDVYNSIEL